MSDLDKLLADAADGMDATLRRIRKLLPDESEESYDFEREAFGIEDPRVVEEAKRAEAQSEPVVDRPARESWRELFRRRWPDGPRKTHGRRR